jgi:hypothetical protein
MLVKILENIFHIGPAAKPVSARTEEGVRRGIGDTWN